MVEGGVQHDSPLAVSFSAAVAASEGKGASGMQRTSVQGSWKRC